MNLLFAHIIQAYIFYNFEHQKAAYNLVIVCTVCTCVDEAGVNSDPVVMGPSFRPWMTFVARSGHVVKYRSTVEASTPGTGGGRVQG